MSDWWMKIRPDLPEQREVITICRSLDLAPTKMHRRHVAWCLIDVWAWAAKHINQYEVVTGMKPDDLDVICDMPGIGRAMLDAGWLKETDTGLKFPSFFKFNEPTRVAKSDAQRSREYRARQRAKRHDTDGPDNTLYDGADADSSALRHETSQSVTTEQEREEELEYHHQPDLDVQRVFLVDLGVTRDAAMRAGGAGGIPVGQMAVVAMRLKTDSRVRNIPGVMLKRIEQGWSFDHPTIDEVFGVCRAHTPPETRVTRNSNGIFVNSKLVCPAGQHEQFLNRLEFKHDLTINWE